MRVSKLVIAMALASSSVSAVADIQAQIAALQGQIQQLQQSISSQTPGNSQGFLGSKLLNLDTRLPFGTLPDTAIPLTILQAKQTTLSAPWVLGGEFEGDLQYWNGNYKQANTVYQTGNGSDVYLTSLNFYTLANLNSWSQAFVALERGGSGDAVQVPIAFVNFGDLTKSPYYLTVGEAYLPFGALSGNGPWANALPTNLFRISNTNQVVLGWNQNAINANVGVYDTGYRSNLADYLLNLNYSNTVGKNSYSAGLSYLSDIRGSNAALGSAYAASGTSASASAPLTGGANPAIDANANINLGSYGFIAEYISTLGSAAVNNNSVGAMSTWTLAGNYNTQLFGKTTQYQISYSGTDHMDAVPMPLNGNAVPGMNTVGTGVRYQWLGSAEIEVANNIYLGPEVAYDWLYNNTQTTTVTVDLSAYF